MTIPNQRNHLFFAALLIVLLLAGCSQATPAPAGAPTGEDPATHQERLSISGAFALFPMVSKWAEEYHALHPNVQFDVQAGGAGKGMTDVLAGAVDIAMVSREIRDEEKAQDAYAVPVTIDAVVATFRAANPRADALRSHGMTPQAGAGIWLNGDIVAWGQLLGTDDAAPISIYTRSDSAGAAEMWAKYLGGKAQEELRGAAVNGDPGLAEAVRQDPLGIGYNNIGFAYDPSTDKPVAGLDILPLDLNGDGRIGADENFYTTKGELIAAIAAHRFPFPPARQLYLVTKGQPNSVAADFIRWILNEGQQFVSQAGYVELDPAGLQAARSLVP